MEITNLNNLIKGEKYVVFIKPGINFSIDQAFSTLGVGKFKGIISNNSFPIGSNKIMMNNVVKWDGRQIDKIYYIDSAILYNSVGTKDILLIKNPTTDREYAEMVDIIARQVKGKINKTSEEILSALLDGTSPINQLNLHIELTPQISTNIPDYECPICLEKITGDGIKTKCGHTFHRQCAERVANNKCPMCRQNMRPFSNVGGKSRHKKRGWRRTKKQRNKYSKKRRINLTKKQLNFTRKKYRQIS